MVTFLMVQFRTNAFRSRESLSNARIYPSVLFLRTSILIICCVLAREAEYSIRIPRPGYVKGGIAGVCMVDWNDAWNDAWHHGEHSVAKVK